MRRLIIRIIVASQLLPLGILFVNCSSASNSTNTSPGTSNTQATKIPINTLTGWSDSPFVSRDGQRLYFMYSRYNFAPSIKSGGTQSPTLGGPDRPGLHKVASGGNPYDESDIYMSTKGPDGTWGEAVNLGLNGAYGDSSGMELNNGNTFIWLQGNGTTNNIVMANKNADGTWATPVDLGTGINNHSAHVVQDNPHISPDGKALWFTSTRGSGVGGKDIWFSTNASGALGGPWSAPVNPGGPVNTTGDEDQIWISPVTTDIYWNGPQGVMHCLSNGSNCAGTPTVVTLPGCTYPGEISIPDDGQIMYFGCVDAAITQVQIMFSKKQANGSWGTATPID